MAGDDKGNSHNVTEQRSFGGADKLTKSFSGAQNLKPVDQVKPTVDPGASAQQSTQQTADASAKGPSV